MKVLGFTLIDVIVALIISSVVVAIGYSCVEMFTSVNVRSNKDEIEMNEIGRLMWLLNKDLEDCHYGNVMNQQIHCVSDERSIIWSFNDNEITRSSFTTDTFNVTSKLNSFWKDQLVFDGVIDKAQVSIVMNKGIVDIICVKDYSVNDMKKYNDIVSQSNQ